jgi:hypothetical protein
MPSYHHFPINTPTVGYSPPSVRIRARYAAFLSQRGDCDRTELARAQNCDHRVLYGISSLVDNRSVWTEARAIVVGRGRFFCPALWQRRVRPMLRDQVNIFKTRHRPLGTRA